MIGMTKRQADLLRFIVGYQRAKGWSPSVVEMATGLGLSSGSGAGRLLDGLEERGLVHRLHNYARAVSVRADVPIPYDPRGRPLYFVEIGR